MFLSHTCGKMNITAKFSFHLHCSLSLYNFTSFLSVNTPLYYFLSNYSFHQINEYNVEILPKDDSVFVVG